jgi:hypothetical protein
MTSLNLRSTPRPCVLGISRDRHGGIQYPPKRKSGPATIWAPIMEAVTIIVYMLKS